METRRNPKSDDAAPPADGAVEVRITDNGMTAELLVTPPGEGGQMPSSAHIRRMIAENRVVFGINEEILKTALTRYAEGIAARETVVIANGSPPVTGENGRVEFCFDTEASPAPTINEDGTADYKNINIISSVSAGTVLARLLPPGKGTPGKDVTGRALPALEGTPAKLPAGANTAAAPSDPSALIALKDGIVRFDGAAVNVSEGYFIDGDVDYSTGNVKYENSVWVKGDVKSGFDVECGGDLEVSGIIENCNINAKGNILCRCGVVGGGKGSIRAGGDISLGYSKNHTIAAGGSVHIARECINSAVTAHGSIYVYGRTLSVAGGALTAANSIEVKTVGNINGIESILKISPNLELAEELAKSKEQFAKFSDNAINLTRTMELTPISKRQDALFLKLQDALYATKEHITRLKKRIDSMTAAMSTFDNCLIHIDRCAYPGTVFMFGDTRMELRETVSSGKTVTFAGGEIKIF